MVQGDRTTILLPTVHLAAVIMVFGPEQVVARYSIHQPTISEEAAGAVAIVVDEMQQAHNWGGQYE